MTPSDPASVPLTPTEAFDRVRAAVAACVEATAATNRHPAYRPEGPFPPALTVPLLGELRAAVALHFAITDATFFGPPPDDIAPWFAVDPSMRGAIYAETRAAVLLFGSLLTILSRAVRGRVETVDAVTGALAAMTRFHEPFGLLPGAVLYLPEIAGAETGFVVAMEGMDAAEVRGEA